MLNKINLSSLGLVLGVTAIAYLTAPMLSGLNSIILGLFLGILVGNLIRLPKTVGSGLSKISGKALEFAILFLAFSIDYGQVKQIGISALLIVVLTIVAVLFIASILMRTFKCKPSTAWLISFGTAICGSSAIAALSPIVSKDRDEAAISIAVVNLLGTIGMIAIPFALAAMGWSEELQAIFIGGSLHSVGNVAGAAYTMGNEVGELALTVKLARVAMLSPALIILNLILNHDKKVHWSKQIKLPWYLIGFVLISIVNSLIQLPDIALSNFNQLGKILLTAAMVGIGMKMSFKTLLTSGKKGISYGLVLFAIQLAIVGGLMLVLM